MDAISESFSFQYKQASRIVSYEVGISNSLIAGGRISHLHPFLPLRVVGFHYPGVTHLTLTSISLDPHFACEIVSLVSTGRFFVLMHSTIFAEKGRYIPVWIDEYQFQRLFILKMSEGSVREKTLAGGLLSPGCQEMVNMVVGMEKQLSPDYQYSCYSYAFYL